MTVQELIQKLTKFSNDAEVIFELNQNATLHELPEIVDFRFYEYSYPELNITLQF